MKEPYSVMEEQLWAEGYEPGDGTQATRSTRASASEPHALRVECRVQSTTRGPSCRPTKSPG
jgi:hypothetical protein